MAFVLPIPDNLYHERNGGIILQQEKEIKRKKYKPLSAASEDYLKTVYYFSQMTESVRSADIAESLGVTKPSVHRAMETLQEADMIVKPLYGEISLTEYGRQRAKMLICKYNLLKELLISIEVDEETAEQDACRMEHTISDKTLSHLLHHFNGDPSHEGNMLYPACWDKEDRRMCFLRQGEKYRTSGYVLSSHARGGN
jgi:Mn-dependent DtxR family transcriptional regulator